MSTNTKCRLFYAFLYMMFYPCLVSFTTTLYLNDYAVEMVSLIVSVCTGAILILKPLFAALFDRGYCRLTCSLCALMIFAGNAFFYFAPVKNLTVALVYGFTVYAMCEVLSEMADVWVVKLAAMDSQIDYGRCRSAGSLSFALTSLCYGSLVHYIGMSIVPILTAVFAIAIIGISFSLEEVKIEKQKQSLADLKSLFGNREFIAFTLLCAIGFCTISLSDNYADVVILEKGGSTLHTGAFDFARCIVETLVMMNATRLLERWGNRLIMIVGMIGLFIKPLALYLAPNALIAVFACLTQGIGFPLVIPAKMEMGAKLVPKEHLALSLSVSSVISSLIYSLLISPLMGVLVGKISTSLALVITSSIALISALGFAFMKDQKKTSVD